MWTAAEWMERHQVAICVAALATGAVAGLAAPAIAGPAESVILPILALLLYATFLSVPLRGLVDAVRDGRFLVTLLVVNFAVVPAVAWLASRFVAGDRVLLVGVLFVLLTPCIDYVMVFTGAAGGDVRRLLAAAPVLMLGQLAALPVFLWAFVGDGFVRTVDPAPFAEAFLLLIVAPLVAAGLTQLAAAEPKGAGVMQTGATVRSRGAAVRSRVGTVWMSAVQSAMVPLMALTLVVVVASQVSGVRSRLTNLVPVMGVYAGFVVIMAAVGVLAGRVAGLDVPGRRAVVFSGVTRNSLVVLPLVLALPAGYELASLVVVSQTLVELVAMVIMVRVVPALVPHHTGPTRHRRGATDPTTQPGSDYPPGG